MPETLYYVGNKLSIFHVPENWFKLMYESKTGNYEKIIIIGFHGLIWSDISF